MAKTDSTGSDQDHDGRSRADCLAVCGDCMDKDQDSPVHMEGFRLEDARQADCLVLAAQRRHGGYLKRLQIPLRIPLCATRAECVR